MTATLPHVEFLETVLFAGDMEDLARTARAFCDCEVDVVHVPFTVAGGHDMDVAASDANLRQASFAAWEGCMELADRVDAQWVVLHPGGVVPPGLGDQGWSRARAAALEHAENALERLGSEYGRDRLLVENMPDHFHRGSGVEHRSAIGRSVVDLASWRDLVGGYCLDVSHACLTAGGAATMDALLERLGRDIRHLHLSDAVPPSGEGAAIGQGVVPWDSLVPRLRALDDEGPGLSAVPEVMGGHLDAGAGFREALVVLGKWFA